MPTRGNRERESRPLCIFCVCLCLYCLGILFLLSLLGPVYMDQRVCHIDGPNAVRNAAERLYA